ncbi:hypothetical protein HNP86_001918 [Methanococcus maripaludis]|uniref:Uncharacterized protein n=1 Tax=Methanococcus maripaludis TaxID=39152 RepID=A0A7J9NVQ3_METMI|nr:hypothetical protein [Methanococcus maripaludis]MBA2851759.1 hypothetical protein [Methanococcus maripaludis]
MLIEEFSKIIKPLKDANCIYVTNGKVKFSYANRAVYGFLTTEYDLPDFKLSYLPNLYDILNTGNYDSNELVITDEILTDNKKAIEYPLSCVSVMPFECIIPNDMSGEIDMTKLKVDYISFEGGGAYGIKEGINARMLLSEKQHHFNATVRIKDKLSLLPKTKYKYSLGGSTLILNPINNPDMYFIVTLDSVYSLEQKKAVDAIFDEL